MDADVIFAGDDAAAGGALAVASDIGALVSEHDTAVRHATDIADLMDDRNIALMDYFLEGNRMHDGSRYGRLSAEQIFKLDGALKAISAAFWSRALKLTDVYECMPKARRDEWDESIRAMKTPPFTEDNVRATLGDLVNARPRFLAERVDGIFRGLSHEHLTNRPEGFGSRMILSYVFNEYGHNTSRVDHIHDLRCVVRSMMGQEAPNRARTWSILDGMRRGKTGQWHVVDGGALRIRVYLKGTAHLEVHPDVAWRLNRILAMLHPGAIPSQFRERPAKPRKAFATLHTPIASDVLDVLGEGALQRGQAEGTHTWTQSYHSEPHARTVEGAAEVLAGLGGAVEKEGRKLVATFDYDVREVLREVLAAGIMPEQVSHQFYPTPPELAERAAALLDPDDYTQVLEPSAGTGALVMAVARLQAITQIHAIELSTLHCKVLAARFPEVNVRRADFLAAVASHSVPGCERIIMNPPFADGRALSHLLAAACVLKPFGRLVAILPASMRGKDLVPGMKHTWSETISNAFRDASVSVAILTLDNTGAP